MRVHKQIKVVDFEVKYVKNCVLIYTLRLFVGNKEMEICVKNGYGKFDSGKLKFEKRGWKIGLRTILSDFFLIY